MGKDFEKELLNLADIHTTAWAANVEEISKFIRKYKDNFFLLVGSGGSFSVARAVEFLCAKSGIMSKSITPLELSNYTQQIQKSAVVLFTASGKNTDSINSYNIISDLEPSGLLTICMSMGSPISKIQRDNIHNYFFEHNMPVKKDGYLAVESLISSITIVAKAFYEITNNPFYDLTNKTYTRKIFEEDLKELFERETIIVLHGGITTPIVSDLESKFGETALGNIQTVDFRNFAHGRHFWLSHRSNSTSIIALADTEHKKVCDKTLSLIPENIPILKIEINNQNVLGLMDTYEYIFEIVNQAGKFAGINPGRPKVSDFGRKMYHIDYKIETSIFDKKSKKDPLLRACYRKNSNIDNNVCYYEYAKKMYDYLTKAIYKGLIFDYDGTLYIKNSNLNNKIFVKINELLENNITIAIATGRGKSVRQELQKFIKPCFWNKVVIAYYNGGCIGTLSDTAIPDKSQKNIPKEFLNIDKMTREEKMVIDIDGINDNPYQLIIPKSEISGNIELIKEKINFNQNIKLLFSGHSIDIVPASSSKNNILIYLEEKGFLEKDFLFVGDSGGFEGNDFELLDRKNGISVDCVSKSLNGCWNFAPLGTRNLEATIYLLDKLEILDSNGCFKLRSL